MEEQIGQEEGTSFAKPQDADHRGEKNCGTTLGDPCIYDLPRL
jgi:hypothetical protein